MTYNWIIILSLVLCFAFYAPKTQAQKKQQRKSVENKIKTAKAESEKLPKTISLGVINGKAIYLEIPEFPEAARCINVYGQVIVQVLIDENGDVIKADALSGHPLLRAPSVKAALNSEFEPVTLGGAAVRVKGIIFYNFMPEKWNWLEIGYTLENSQSTYYKLKTLQDTLPIGFQEEKQFLMGNIRTGEDRNKIIETVTALIENKIVGDEKAFWLFSVGLSLAKIERNRVGRRLSSNQNAPEIQKLKSLINNPPKKIDNNLVEQLSRFIHLTEQNKIDDEFYVLKKLKNNFLQLGR